MEWNLALKQILDVWSIDWILTETGKESKGTLSTTINKPVSTKVKHI
jgi:hypothetical protein